VSTTEFKHKGTDIIVTAGGEFTARVNGIDLTAGSLAAIRKKIDKSAPFTPFDAFTVDDFYQEGIRKHRIVGVKKIRGRLSHEFITDKGHTIQNLHVSSKAALERAKKWLDQRAKHRKQREAMEKLEDKLQEEIGESVSADEFIKEKSGGQPAAE
jgi:hypothetical protein